MTDVRRIAYETLLMVEEGKGTNTLTKDVLDKYSYLDVRDRGLLKRLIEGVTERRISIDHVLDQFSTVKVKKMKKQVRTLLRMGVYQLLYMDKMEDHAAIFETVRIAKKMKGAAMSGFVNAVLRAVSKNIDDIVWPAEEDGVIKYLSVKYSCPEWIVEKLISEQGRDKAEDVLALSVSVRPVTARVNLSVTTVEDVISSGEAKASEICDIAVSLSDHDDIASLSIVSKGDVVIQDIASMLVCLAAGIRESDTVLDLCAAPGGKSLHAADIATKGHVYAFDVSSARASRIEENANRCGFTNITVETMDATQHDTGLEGFADVVIADVPCSGLGVMGRKNDIKYSITPGQIEELAALQKKILENAATYVRDGGTLIFSTCTCSEAENQGNVRFLTEKCGLEPVGFYDLLPERLRDDTAKEGYIQLYGKDKATDGFFIARFTK